MRLRSFIFLLLVAGLSTGCIKDNLGLEDSYFYASLDGPSWSGEVEISGNETDLSAQAVVSPSNDPAVPDALVMTYNDSEAGYGVSITVPAEERTTELTDGSNIFGMALTSTQTGSDAIILGQQTVSVDITKLKLSSQVGGFDLPTVVEGTFTGVMIREVIENGQVIEEAHTVMGEFRYYL